MYQELFKKYLDDLASSKPAPGGGSASALVAAAGLSLISMPASLTVGKEKYRAVEDEVKNILSSCEQLRQRVAVLIDKDILAYAKVAKAYALAKDTEKNRQTRSQAIQQALKEALIVPLEICKLSYQGIKLCPPIAEKGNPNLISDVGVAVLFLEAAYQGALLNVQINLKYIKDQQVVVKICGILEPMEREIPPIKQQVITKVKTALSK